MDRVLPLWDLDHFVFFDRIVCSWNFNTLEVFCDLLLLFLYWALLVEVYFHKLNNFLIKLPFKFLRLKTSKQVLFFLRRLQQMVP